MMDAQAWVEEIVSEVWRTLDQRGGRPAATYRLEFRKGHFAFRDAAAVVPYLRQLGIRHVYLSPYLKTRTCSPHGYSVVDYGSLDPQLGSDEDYAEMLAALKAAQMGQILDFVPNHMSASPGENPWWNDVLENGPSSPYADHFDIDWQPLKGELKNKVLLPMLGSQFGVVLEAGELVLEYHEGAFRVRYYDRVLPLDPRTFTTLLNHRLEELKESLPADSEDVRELESIATALDYLPDRLEREPDRVQERQREKEVAKDRLHRLVERSSPIAEFVKRNVAEFNGKPGDPASFDRLEELLDAQAYRLSHWKAASDEINYRRFFDINELAAVCMEQPDVFEHAHRFVFELLAEDKVSGLRIDHIDGLFGPTQYLWRLQWGYLRALARQAHERLHGDESRPSPADGETPCWEDLEPQVLGRLWQRVDGTWPGELFPSSHPGGGPPTADAAAEPGLAPSLLSESGDPPLYVVVEKILGPEEPLPPEWPVAGTTGYDFLNLAAGLFVDPAGLAEIVKSYQRFARQKTDWEEVTHQTRLLILRVSMSSELQLLAYRLNRISERHRLSRDFTLNTLRAALREILACFPVYRTYIAAGRVSDRDRQVVTRAAAQAKRRNPAMDAAVFDFIRGVLLLEEPPELDEAGCRDRELFVGRFQQVTSPVMAKGIEDTAFYRSFPLSSLCEVGGEPSRALTTVEQFHADNLARQSQRPRSLIATTTHDTKRSEDVRARISVLSEVPRLWRTAANRWNRLNRRHRREVDGHAAPSRNDEYLFYQTLVGVWPLEPLDEAGHRQLVERMLGYVEKATHEAKLRTSWISPDPDYDAAVRQFVTAVLENHPRNRFLTELQALHEKVVDWGLYTALSQVTLKLTSPGVPDIYQGQETWDFSLVDPDNRRPVDFAARRAMLAELQEEMGEDGEALPALARRLAATCRDPRLKLLVTWRALQFRERHNELFRSGRYVPLVAEGPRAEHVCAFAWQLAATDGRREQIAIVVAPRLVARLCSPQDPLAAPPPPIGSAVWQDTRLIAAELAPWPLTNCFTGMPCTFEQSCLRLADVLADFPVALLTNAE